MAMWFERPRKKEPRTKQHLMYSSVKAQGASGVQALAQPATKSTRSQRRLPKPSLRSSIALGGAGRPAIGLRQPAPRAARGIRPPL